MEKWAIILCYLNIFYNNNHVWAYVDVYTCMKINIHLYTKKKKKWFSRSNLQKSLKKIETKKRDAWLTNQEYFICLLFWRENEKDEYFLLESFVPFICFSFLHLLILFLCSPWTHSMTFQSGISDIIIIIVPLLFVL